MNAAELEIRLIGGTEDEQAALDSPQRQGDEFSLTRDMPSDERSGLDGSGVGIDRESADIGREAANSGDLTITRDQREQFEEGIAARTDGVNDGPLIDAIHDLTRSLDETRLTGRVADNAVQADETESRLDRETATPEDPSRPTGQDSADPQQQGLEREDVGADDGLMNRMVASVADLSKKILPDPFAKHVDRLAGLLTKQAKPERSQSSAPATPTIPRRRQDPESRIPISGRQPPLRTQRDEPPPPQTLPGRITRTLSNTSRSLEERFSTARESVTQRVSDIRERVTNNVRSAVERIQTSRPAQAARESFQAMRERSGRARREIVEQLGQSGTGRTILVTGNGIGSFARGTVQRGRQAAASVARPAVQAAGGLAARVGIGSVASSGAATAASGGALGGAAGLAGGTAAALGPVGLAVTAVVAALGGAVLAVRTFTNSVSRAANEIEDYSPEVAAVRSEAEVGRELQTLDRAERIGPEVARIEEARARLSESSYEIQTRLYEIALRGTPILEDLLDSLNVVLRGMDVGTASINTLVARIATPFDTRDDNEAVVKFGQALDGFNKALKELSGDEDAQRNHIDPVFRSLLDLDGFRKRNDDPIPPGQLEL